MDFQKLIADRGIWIAPLSDALKAIAIKNPDSRDKPEFPV